MIVQAIWNLIESTVVFVLELAPNFVLPSWWASTGAGSLGNLAASLGEHLAGLNNWLPITELLAVIPFVFTITFGILGFRIIVWAYGLIRGGGA